MKIYAASLMAYKFHGGGHLETSHTARAFAAETLEEATGYAVEATKENWPGEGWNHTLPALVELNIELMLNFLGKKT